MTAQGSAASEARRNHCSEALWSVAASPDGPDSNDINELAAWVETEIDTAKANLGAKGLNHIRAGRGSDTAVCGFQPYAPRPRKGAYCNACVDKVLGDLSKPVSLWPWKRKKGATS